MKVFFMGTPEFAVPTLSRLAADGYDLAGIITQPDKPKDRGRKIAFSPVKIFALAHDTAVYQPDTVRSDVFLNMLKTAAPDIIVVVAFGQMLPESLLDIPRLGVVNLHASLLPKYRGASPINMALINGEKLTGVTTMFIEEKMDAGDILLQKEVRISEEDTFPSLYEKLSRVGAELVSATLKGLAKNDIYPIPQDSTQATYAPLLKKEDGHISWEAPAEKIRNLIRGTTPWPGAFTYLGDLRLKIFGLAGDLREAVEPPGTIVDAGGNFICVATADMVVAIDEIQPENGRRMKVAEYLKGHDVKKGTVLS